MREFKPILIGDLYVSCFRRDFLTDRYVGWLNDPQVVRFSEQRHLQHSLESCEHYFEAMDHSQGLFLSLEVKGSEMGHIGNISVVIDDNNSSADLSIMIGEKCAWGKGYASKAWITVMMYLLNDAGIRRVTAGTMDVNEPMIRLMRRSQMEIDCIRPRHFLWEGREVGFVMGSCFRRDIKP